MSANNAHQSKHQQPQASVCRSRSLSPSASVASSTIDEVCGLADRRDDEDVSSLGETLELNAPPPHDTDADWEFLQRVAQLNRQISAQLLDAVTSSLTPQSVQGSDSPIATVNGTAVQCQGDPKLLRRHRVKKRSARRLTLELLTSDDEANEFAEQRSSPYLEPQTRRSRQEERPHLKSSFETLYGGGGEEADDSLTAPVADVGAVDDQLESSSKSRACQTDTGDAACQTGAENRAIANGRADTATAAAIGPPAVGAVAVQREGDMVAGRSRVDVGGGVAGGHGLRLQSAIVLVPLHEQSQRQQQKQRQQQPKLSVSEQLKQLFPKQTEQPKRPTAVVTSESTRTAVASVTAAATVENAMAAGGATVKQPEQQQQQQKYKLSQRRCLQHQQQVQPAANHVSRVTFSVASASPPLSAPAVPPRRAHQPLQRRCKSIQALAPAAALSNGDDAAFPHCPPRDQPSQAALQAMTQPPCRTKTLRFRSGSFGDLNCYYPAPRPQSSCLEIGVLLQRRPRWQQNRRHDAELVVTRLLRIDRADPVSELELMCRRMRLDDADLMEGAEQRDHQEQSRLPPPQLRRRRNRTPDRLLDDQARRRIAWREQQQLQQHHQQPLNFIGRASDGAKAQQQGRNGIVKATPQPSATPFGCLHRTHRFVNNASTSNRASINSNQYNCRKPAAASVTHQSTCLILSNLAEDDADTEDTATATGTSTTRHRVRHTRWRWMSKAAGKTTRDAESSSDGSTSVASSTTDANGALDLASSNDAASDDTDDDGDASDYDNHDEARGIEKPEITSSLGLRKAASLNDVGARVGPWWGHPMQQQQQQQQQQHYQLQQRQQQQQQHQHQRQRFWKTLEVRYGSEGELCQLADANSIGALSVARRRSCTSSYFVHIRSRLSHQPLLEEEIN